MVGGGARGRADSPVLLLLAAALMPMAGCYDLNKVDPGPRWIDDFSSDSSSASMPTWNAFSEWGCGTYSEDDTADGGTAPAGDDAGVGSLPTCPLGPGDMNSLDSNDTKGLAFAFDFASGMGLGAVAETFVVSPAPLDFTGFRQLVFSAKLQSASLQNPLPSGTALQVDLRCLRNGRDNLASQPVPATMLTIDSTAWALVRLDLSGFALQHSSVSQACLSEVDRIRFLVPPGMASMPTIAGMLALDNISLQN